MVRPMKPARFLPAWLYCVLLLLSACRSESDTAFDEASKQAHLDYLFEDAGTLNRTITIEGNDYNLRDAVTNALRVEEDNYKDARLEYIRFVRDILTDDIYYIYLSYGADEDKSEEQQSVGFGRKGAVIYSIVDGPFLASHSQTFYSNLFTDSNAVYYMSFPRAFVLNDDGSISELHIVSSDAERAIHYAESTERVTLESIRQSMEGGGTMVHDKEGKQQRIEYISGEDGIVRRKRTIME